MQYVRTEIEEKYRIIAIISLPQFAFMANGAGVKSSIMFLRKNKTEEIDEIINTKYQIRTNIWESSIAKSEIRKLQKECDAKIRALPRNDSYKEEKAKINAEYKIRIEKIKEVIYDEYDNQCQQKLYDYPIFMAIAEEIGYDATGKKTANNELEIIGEELKKFIATL